MLIYFMVLLTVFEVCKVQFFKVKVIFNDKNLGFYVRVCEEERKDGMKERLCIDSLNTHISVFPPYRVFAMTRTIQHTMYVTCVHGWVGVPQCI